jgi:hypothetical protein
MWENVWTRSLAKMVDAYLSMDEELLLCGMLPRVRNGIWEDSDLSTIPYIVPCGKISYENLS